MPEGFIDSNTVLVLTDTLYFNADWERPFGKYDPSTAASGAQARAQGQALGQRPPGVRPLFPMLLLAFAVVGVIWAITRF